MPSLDPRPSYYCTQVDRDERSATFGQPICGRRLFINTSTPDAKRRDASKRNLERICREAGHRPDVHYQAGVRR